MTYDHFSDGVLLCVSVGGYVWVLFGLCFVFGFMLECFRDVQLLAGLF